MMTAVVAVAAAVATVPMNLDVMCMTLYSS